MKNEGLAWGKDGGRVMEVWEKTESSVPFTVSA